MVLLAASMLLVSCITVSPPPFDEAAWRKKVESGDPALLYAPHFKDGRYFNPWMVQEERGFFEFVKWKLGNKASYTEEEESILPKVIGNAAERIAAMPQGDFIMWVGHATFLFRIDGEYWLTDPMFSERALLPKRVTPPALTLGELGRIAGRLNVIVSHNHHDHLDAATIKGLPDSARIFVPMGLKEYVRGLKAVPVEEMDWWQERDLGKGVKLVCLPAQHWSRRLGQGYNESLWASFLIITPRLSIYFGGDSGYFIGYRETGRRYPAIDYALLPTTAYHPRWFMHYAHTDIGETLDAFDDLKARFMVPTQWGTFHLGDDPPGYPILDLKRRIAERNLDPARFLIMDLGEIRPLKGKNDR